VVAADVLHRPVTGPRSLVHPRKLELPVERIPRKVSPPADKGWGGAATRWKLWGTRAQAREYCEKRVRDRGGIAL